MGEWLRSATLRLRHTHPSDEAAVEAQALMTYALGCSRPALFTHPEKLLTADNLAALTNHLERLLQGEPLPYLTGIQEFYGLSVQVSPAVLIPRPETELMVDYALKWLRSHPQRRHAVDIGTGSGCITAALAYNCADLSIIAVDRSRAALNMAMRNLIAFSLTQQVQIIQGDLLSAIDTPLDIICANLPYIPSIAVDYLDVTRHEPRMALDGGGDGLRLISALLTDAPRLLTPGGVILLEIESGQAESVQIPARAAFPEANIQILPDLSGLPRLVVIDLPL